MDGGSYCRVFILFRDAAGRTDIGALSAIDADRLILCLFQGVCAMYANLVGTDLFTHATSDTCFFISADTRIILFNGNPNIHG